MSNIEWTEKTWNPLTGCDKVSPGCKHCYAETMSKRLHAMGQAKYRNQFDLTLHEDALETPLQWKTPATVFVNSMSDLFHKDVPTEFIQQVFATMNRAHWHRFQVLTKRAERVADLSGVLEWGPNIWMGVSVENADYTHRLARLRATGAAVKFLSLEPLLGPLKELDLTGIDWVIVGGESGAGCRPFETQWARGIRDQCRRSGTAFFMKQVGGNAYEGGERMKTISKKGGDPEEWPEELRAREMPDVAKPEILTT